MPVPEMDHMLAAAQRGDPDGLAAVYERLAPSVLGYLRGQRAAEPEDLTSEVFVAVVRGLPRFRGGEADLRAWVFTIAHRRLQDERRRRARRPLQLVPPEQLPEVAGTTPDAEEQTLARLDTAAALELLDRLTPVQREVLLLRFVADLPIERVARIVGRRPGAVKALQHRALASLGRQISSEQAVSPELPPAMTRVT